MTLLLFSFILQMRTCCHRHFFIPSITDSFFLYIYRIVLFWDRDSSCHSGWFGTQRRAQVVPTFIVILLPQFLEFRDDRHRLPSLIALPSCKISSWWLCVPYICWLFVCCLRVLHIVPRASRLLGKCSTSPTHIHTEPLIFWHITHQVPVCLRQKWADAPRPQGTLQWRMI